jgi:hypothetical protein
MRASIPCGALPGSTPHDTDRSPSRVVIAVVGPFCAAWRGWGIGVPSRGWSPGMRVSWLGSRRSIWTVRP